MPIDTSLRINRDTLLPIAIEAKKRLGCDPGKWNDYEMEQIRQKCGPRYAAIPLTNVRNQCETLRKNGRLPKSHDDNNHGATRRDALSPEYLAYLKSEHWRRFSEEVKKFWKYRCAICNSSKKLDAHHREYVNCLYHETLSDAVCLCRRCHVMADRARQREAMLPRTERSMFLDFLDSQF